MSQLRHHYPDIQRLGAELLVVTPSQGADLRRYGEELGLESPLLSDPQGVAYRSYSLGRGTLWRVWGPRTLLAYARLLLRGRRLHVPTEDLYQLGGDFVIDGQGILRYAYRSREPTDRPAVAELLAVLASLAKGASN